MTNIKRYLQFIKENQTKIQFKDIDAFSFDIDDFIKLCEDHALELLNYSIGNVVRDEDGDFDYINIKGNIFPSNSYEIGYKIDFKKDSSEEFGSDTLGILIDYLRISHDDWDIITTTDFGIGTFTLNILSCNLQKISIDEWLTLYSNWEKIDNKIIIKTDSFSLTDKFEFKYSWCENVVDGSDNIEYYFNYDSLNTENAVYMFDDDNKELLSKINNSDDDSLPPDIERDIMYVYEEIIIHVNEEEAYSKTLSTFENYLEREFSLIIHKREFINNNLFYWYEFNIDWVLDIKKEDYNIPINSYLDSIFHEWFNTVYGGYRIDFDTPEVQFSTWLDKKKKEEYNRNVKSILLNHLN